MQRVALGLNSWSVLLSKCMFLPPHHVVSVALSEASERSIHVALGDDQAEMANGHPLGANIISLSSPLIGPALRELLALLTSSRPIPVFRMLSRSLQDLRGGKRLRNISHGNEEKRMAFRNFSDISFHSVVANAKAEEGKIQMSAHQRTEPCFNIKILLPDEALDGRATCKQNKNGGVLANIMVGVPDLCLLGCPTTSLWALETLPHPQGSSPSTPSTI